MTAGSLLHGVGDWGLWPWVSQDGERFQWVRCGYELDDILARYSPSSLILFVASYTKLKGNVRSYLTRWQTLVIFKSALGEWCFLWVFFPRTCRNIENSSGSVNFFCGNRFVGQKNDSGFLQWASDVSLLSIRDGGWRWKSISCCWTNTVTSYVKKNWYVFVNVVSVTMSHLLVFLLMTIATIITEIFKKFSVIISLPFFISVCTLMIILSSYDL